MRDHIYLAQTPQAFRRASCTMRLLPAARGGDATDEASLAERAGHAVRIVEGERTNIKVTTPEDLAVAEARAGGAAAPRDSAVGAGRVGTGYDLHRLVEGRPLILGGVTVPSSRGALGHSDADVVCHAVTDAILGAASLGDIGRHFPDTDPQWKDASSLDLLRRVAALVAAEGFVVVNVDVTVVLEQPKDQGLHRGDACGGGRRAGSRGVSGRASRERPTRGWMPSAAVGDRRARDRASNEPRRDRSDAPDPGTR